MKRSHFALGYLLLGILFYEAVDWIDTLWLKTGWLKTALTVLCCLLLLYIIVKQIRERKRENAIIKQITQRNDSEEKEETGT